MIKCSAVGVPLQRAASLRLNAKSACRVSCQAHRNGTVAADEFRRGLEVSLGSGTAPVVQQTLQTQRSIFPRLISAAGNSADEVAAIVQTQLEQFPQALVTDAEPEMYASMRKLVPGVQYHARAKMLICKPQETSLPKQQKIPGTVCVVSAGPEDQSAADQVKLAAEHLGCYVLTKRNLSIINMPQLMDQMPAIQAADVVVVIAGADNALPGVVAGMVDAPVIAVPVSTGSTNNNSLQGLGNLVSAVSSCVPGVAVVNLDGAAAAAVMAAKVLRTAAVRVEKLMAAQSVAAASAPAPAASAPAPTAVPSFVLPSDITVNNVVPAYEGLALPAVQPAAV